MKEDIKKAQQSLFDDSLYRTQKQKPQKKRRGVVMDEALWKMLYGDKKYEKN
jgi:hypothetical protein